MLPGFSVAFSPSVLLLTDTPVIWVVVPSLLTLWSLKVDLLSEARSILSEKVALRSVVRLTPLLASVGEVVLTLGE